PRGTAPGGHLDPYAEGRAKGARVAARARGARRPAGQARVVRLRRVATTIAAPPASSTAAPIAIGPVLPSAPVTARSPLPPFGVAAGSDGSEADGSGASVDGVAEGSSGVPDAGGVVSSASFDGSGSDGDVGLLQVTTAADRRGHRLERMCGGRLGRLGGRRRRGIVRGARRGQGGLLGGLRRLRLGRRRRRRLLLLRRLGREVPGAAVP